MPQPSQVQEHSVVAIVDTFEVPQPSATTEDGDGEGFVFEEDEETHVILKMDIDKLRRIANLSSHHEPETQPRE